MMTVKSHPTMDYVFLFVFLLSKMQPYTYISWRLCLVLALRESEDSEKVQRHLEKLNFAVSTINMPETHEKQFRLAKLTAKKLYDEQALRGSADERIRIFGSISHYDMSALSGTVPLNGSCLLGTPPWKSLEALVSVSVSGRLGSSGRPGCFVRGCHAKSVFIRLIMPYLQCVYCLNCEV